MTNLEKGGTPKISEIEDYCDSLSFVVFETTHEVTKSVKPK